MAYRPIISILNFGQDQKESTAFSSSIMSAWPDHQLPVFTSANPTDCDVVLVFARDYNELLQSLPALLELQTADVPTVLACDEYGVLKEIANNLDVIRISHSATTSLIAGVLFGIVQRNPEISQLRGQVGLVRKLHCSLQDDLNDLHDELTSAATMQREFMSNDVKEVHGFSFSSLWRPASVVSGDMFDITQLDEDHVAIFIADAIGHGISAAMLAMILTRTIAANRVDSLTGEFVEPCAMLQHLNEALLQRAGDKSRFATAAYAIMNCKTNTLTFAGAGHPPALLSKFGSDPVLIESDGPLLGVFEKETFPQQTIQLTAGDKLLLYSDGFEHAMGYPTDDSSTMPPYVQTMQEFCCECNGDVLPKIIGYLDTVTPDSIDDDLTMICLHAKAIPSKLRLAA